MTKNLKRLLSAVLAVVMVLAMGSFTAFADGTDNTTTVTVTNANEGHTYTAYQVFSGTQNEGSTALGDVKWGSGVDTTSSKEIGSETKTLIEFIKEITDTSGETTSYPFANVVTAADVASILAKYSDATYYTDTTDVANQFANIVDYFITGDGVALSTATTSLEKGYYLIVDTTTVSSTENFVYNKSLLQVTGNEIAITAKLDVPTSDKKVKDVNDSVSDSETDWQKSADYDLGDDVPFQLTGTVAANYADYDTYTYIFHDEQSAGLTFNNDVKVYYQNTGDSKRTEIDSGNYTVATTDLDDDCTFEIQFTDLKKVTGITAGATITVEYTSKLTGESVVYGKDGNPNESWLEFSNNPNSGGEGTGTTPPKTVVVFTYILTADKYANSVADGNELKGAGFTLYKYDADYTNKDNDGNAINTTEDDKWRAVGEEVTGKEMTHFEWKGLDDGNYKLVETTTPAGYNTIAPIVFTITATHNATDGAGSTSLTALTATSEAGSTVTFNTETATQDINELSTVHTNIINNSGSTLPETGGMGTKIFYTLGGILVVAAGILLITKRRMRNA